MNQTLGEIRMVAFPRVPVGWHLCDGSTLPISGNEALYSVIGTTYGGDGIKTFGLPDLRGRTPAGFGQGNQLPNYAIGQQAGSEEVTLNITNLPAHTHTMASNSTAGAGSLNQPSGAVAAVGPVSTSTGAPVNTRFAANATPGAAMNVNMISIVGSGYPIDNMQPVLVVNYIIATQGIYPVKPS